MRNTMPTIPMMKLTLSIAVPRSNPKHIKIPLIKLNNAKSGFVKSGKVPRNAIGLGSPINLKKSSKNIRKMKTNRNLHDS